MTNGHRLLVVVHTLLSPGTNVHEAHYMKQVAPGDNVRLTRTTRHRRPRHAQGMRVIVYIILQSEDVPLITHGCLVVVYTLLKNQSALEKAVWTARQR